MSTLLQLGEEIRLEESIQLPREIDSFWIVKEGSVEVFIEETENGKKKPCKLLISFEKGEFFIPLNNELQSSLFFTKVSGITKLQKIAFAELKEQYKKNPSLLQETAKYFNAFIKRLYDEMIPIPNDNISLFLLPDKDMSFSMEHKGQDVSGFFTHTTKDKILWLEIKKGSFSFLNQTSIIIDAKSPPFPLSYKGWLKVQQASEVRTYSTEDILVQDSLLDSIAHFQICLEKYYIVSEKILNERAKQRSTIKKEIEKKIVLHTFEKIFSIFHKKSLFSSFTPSHPLLQSLRILEKLTKIPWKFPPKYSHPDSPISMLQEICEYSHVRYRKIELENEFWKKDCGTLLGFMEEDHTIILLNPHKNGYEAVDPISQKRHKIDREFFKKISKEAYEFYPPYLQEVITLKTIFQNYLQGKQKSIFQWAFFSIITIFLSFFVPLANAIIFDRIIPVLDTSLLYQVGLGLLVASLSYGIFSFLSSFAALHLQIRINTTFQTALWDRLLRLPTSFFRENSLGDLLRRVFSISNLQLFLPPTFLSSIFLSLFALLYLILMFFYSPLLSFFSLTLFGFAAVIHIFLIKTKIKIELKVLDTQGTLNGFLLHVMNGIEKIRLSASEATIFSRWGSLYTPVRKNILVSNHIDNILSLANSILPLLGLFGTFFFGFLLISKGTISPGNFIAFTAAFGAFSSVYYSTLFSLSNYYGTIVSRWKRAKLIFDTPTEYFHHPISPGKLKGFIEMENVQFRYRDKGPLLLQNATFKVEPGEMIGIVGPSGSGKSTLLRLLLQFETPFSGAIYFDGKNLSDLDARKVRKQIGVVLQDSDILSGSIRENLLSGCFYSKEQLDKAMHITGLDKVLETFPMGLFTHLVDKGKNLSLGQKQLLLLTRALISEPKILLLDEATNSLDNHTQALIMENLEKLKMTRIIIAHRISTLQNADRIYVLNEGRMDEMGTYEELIQRKGFFTELLEGQIS